MSAQGKLRGGEGGGWVVVVHRRLNVTPLLLLLLLFPLHCTALPPPLTTHPHHPAPPHHPQTHIDIVEDFDQDLVDQLVGLAVKHDFLLFEDRKFADIGNTVRHQYAHGVYHIARWSHITNAHPVPGDGIVEGLREVGLHDPTIRVKATAPSTSSSTPHSSTPSPSPTRSYLHLPRALLLLAEMSSRGSMATGAYTRHTVAMARRHADFCIGFIAGRRLTGGASTTAEENDAAVESSASPSSLPPPPPPPPEEDFLTMTPGVQVAAGSGTDTLGQQYRTPDQVIERDWSDVIIVGRGIYAASNPAQAAQEYQRLGWQAYLRRLEHK